ncbi:MAG: hypothetical protein IT176_14860 [Acidobacteria bacterium]|nr:hypothetical protein [Acidobacteriota bacterium]
MGADRDDLQRLKAERDAADRAYNDALTRLDRAIQALPQEFPHPPPGPDEHQIGALHALWKIDAAPPGGGLRGRVFALVRQAVGPLVARQETFNAAVADHVHRNVPVARQTREAIESTLAVLRTGIAELNRFESLLVMFLQQITPYVDTRDRDVAGLLRGLSGAINAVADETMKRSEAAAVAELRLEARVDALEHELAVLRQQLARLAPAPRAPLGPSEA